MNFDEKGRRCPIRAYLCLAAILLLAGIASAEDAPRRCQYKLAQTLRVHFDGVRPTIEAGINGKPVRLLVDSGSFTTVLFQHSADKLGLTLRHSPMTILGVGGESETYLARIKEARFGDSIGRNIEIPVIRRYSEALSVDGLVGAEFLFQRADMEMSMIGRYLKFFKPVGCEDTLLSYWDPDAAATNFRLGTEEDPRLEIDVLVNGKKLRALIDTGAATTMIDLRAAEAMGITTTSPNVVKSAYGTSGIGAHETSVWTAQFESVEIGGELIKNPKIRIADVWSGVRKDVKRFGIGSWIGEQPGMILGIDFLRSHRLLFSIEQKRMYFTYVGGSVFRTDSQDDLSWFEAAAAHGDVDAQVNLGLRYLHGDGTKRDSSKAYQLFDKAAAQGDKRALVELGLLNEFGDGTERNPTKAVELYRKAADAGIESGEANLGRAYELGIGVGKDPAQAFRWYQKAADQGNSYSQGKVAIAYMLGKGVNKDDGRASEWLDNALKDGKPGRYYLMLGMTMFNSGLYAQSEAALKKAVEQSPEDEYATIWLYLARARSGKNDGIARTFEEARPRWKAERAWQATIADFYLGRITADQFMTLARHANRNTENEQVCEANYYSAEWHLVAGRRAEARPLLDAAARSCPGNFIEREAALAELERFDAK